MPAIPRTTGSSGSIAAQEGVYGTLFGPAEAANTNASTGAIAGLATDIIGGSMGVNLFLTGAQSGGVNYTLASVASIVTALENLAGGFTALDYPAWSYKLRVMNVGTTQIITMAAGTGWTLGTGLYTLANNTFRDFLVTFTSPTAMTLQDLGSGTYP